MEIIVRSSKSEKERRMEQYAAETRQHYYAREIRDGSRFKSKAGTKEQIRKALGSGTS